MKTERDNQSWYQNTFDEVHASEHLLRKVEAMKQERETMKKILPKGAIAAAAFGILVFSNAITYAASGSPWILTITLPGGETREMEIDPLEDGVQVTDYDFADSSAAAEAAGSAEADVTLEVSDEDSTYRLEREGEHVYLILDADCRVDITEEFKDGTCKGSLDTEDGTWCYEVTGTPEDYDAQVYFVTYDVK